MVMMPGTMTPNPKAAASPTLSEFAKQYAIIEAMFQPTGGVQYAPPVGGQGGGGGGIGAVYPKEAIGAGIFEINKYKSDLAYQLMALEQAGRIAKMQESGATSRAGIAAGAGVQGARISASAQLEAARISSQARLKEASIQAQTAKYVVNTTTGSDQKVALMQEQSAERKVQAELNLQAQLATYANLFKLAEMLSSGRMSDTLAGRFYLAGQG